MKKLLVIDKKDRILSYENKEECHRKGILHRAFTILILNSKGQILIQKRSKYKMLWPDCWEASCSSHPLKGESLIGASRKRLKKELGLVAELDNLDKFLYFSKYGKIGSEHEVCYLLAGKYDGEINPNLKEVSEYKWIDPDKLKKDLIKNPRKYAPWLKLALRKYLKS